jgi:hypothetical protein
MRLSALLFILTVIGCAPMGETPGVRLGGSAAARPDSFTFVRDTEVIQLEAQGAILPRVVNIWAVGFDEAIYVWSDPGSGWSQRVEKRPNDVRVRVGNDVFRVKATRVTEASETERVAHAYQEKYAEGMIELYGEISPVDDFELLYRLTPRD